MDIRPGVILNGPDGAAITVEALLGQGGFGQVFAGSLPDGTRVAIKTVLTSALDTSELRRSRMKLSSPRASYTPTSFA
ncbi:MAG TPA: hypothetical protein VIX17_02030 [Pyrinomonadaceae bacterium]|jgi:hypothetical protein